MSSYEGSANYTDDPGPDPFAAAVDGAQLLADVAAFLGRFVAYPSAAAHTAHALWCAHAHLMDAWESTPRIAFLSPEPGSGKTRALEVTELLVPRPVEAVNVSPSYLFRKVSDVDGRPTILFDEVDTVFGPRAKENEEIRGLLNAGHRRGAVAGRCVVKGKTVEVEELPAYCAVALAGLGGLPDTILTRSVIVQMRRRAPGERVEPYRRRLEEGAGHKLRDRLAEWAEAITSTVQDAWPDMPAGIADRDADVWEPLLAVADAAGGDWPELARCGAVALVAAAKGAGPSLGVRLLADLRDEVFGDRDVMSTAAILEALHNIEEAPWADLRGRPLDARGLARRLKDYGVKSITVRTGEGDSTPKGYRRSDLADPWSRYLGEAGKVSDDVPLEIPLRGKEEEGQEALGQPHNRSATSATPPQTEPADEPDEPPATCQECSADLWAPQSRARGTCERCWLKRAAQNGVAGARCGSTGSPDGGADLMGAEQ